jgi:hypothetical protein
MTGDVAVSVRENPCDRFVDSRFDAARCDVQLLVDDASLEIDDHDEPRSRIRRADPQMYSVRLQE